jgi:hypothetical protein
MGNQIHAGLARQWDDMLWMVENLLGCDRRELDAVAEGVAVLDGEANKHGRSCIQ